MVKDYSFSNDEAEILIVDVANAIKSVIYNGKTCYRIVKTNVSDDTVLFRDTQEETPEDITTEDTIILDETDVITTRDTATNTISNEQEVDNVLALIEKKFNDLSCHKVEKRLHNIEDQMIGMQLSDLSGNNVSGKAVTSKVFYM